MVQITNFNLETGDSNFAFDDFKFVFIIFNFQFVVMMKCSPKFLFKFVFPNNNQPILKANGIISEFSHQQVP